MLKVALLKLKKYYLNITQVLLLKAHLFYHFLVYCFSFLKLIKGNLFFLSLGYFYSKIIYYRKCFQNTNKLFYYLLLILTFPFYFYEKIFRFYNDYSYVMISIDGLNFFESSKNSALLVYENFFL